MKQIDYFKFLKIFPELIDIDETNEVKLVLLKVVRKDTWRKKGKSDLLPLKMVKHGDFDKEFFNRFDMMKGHSRFKITYRKETLMSIFYVKDDVYINPDFYFKQMNNSKFMSKEEVTNIKRTILIDDMLKNKKKQ